MKGGKWAGAILAAALALYSGSVSARQSQETSDSSLPLLAGVVVAPDCGGVDMGATSVCLQTTVQNLQTAFDDYAVYLQQAGWTTLAEINNGLILVAPRDDGGCDGLALVAFVNDALGSEPSSPGYLAIVSVPGDSCPAGTASDGPQ